MAELGKVELGEEDEMAGISTSDQSILLVPDTLLVRGEVEDTEMQD